MLTAYQPRSLKPDSGCDHRSHQSEKNQGTMQCKQRTQAQRSTIQEKYLENASFFKDQTEIKL